ncbi:unnamed protein product [Anisakis simplex]|uniref:ShKT domain-containing protein n=1 Tax=Anisakis simplex TaxID=6269 RepID=A0A0M3J6U3_ANISI|nr:unnamed protein product [Anisakis simplex]
MAARECRKTCGYCGGARNNLETVTSSNSSFEDEEGEVMDRNQTSTSESIDDRLHNTPTEATKTEQKERRKRKRTEAPRKRGRKGRCKLKWMKFK